MSVFSLYFVQCDECAEEADVSAPRIAEDRKAAVGKGWKKVGGSDFCSQKCLDAARAAAPSSGKVG